MVIFNKVENASVVLKTKGVYHPTSVYELDKVLFAKFGKGYVKIMNYSATTSLAGVNWSNLNLPFTPLKGKLQALIIPETEW